MAQASPRKSYPDHQAMWTELMDEIKRRYPIDKALDDMTGGVQWRSGGPVRKAICPFHVDKSPSFSANTEMGVFYCFGAGCGASGNVFTLVRDTLGVTPRQAVIEAADLAGVTVPSVLRERAKSGPQTRGPRPPGQAKTPGYKPGAVREIPTDIKPSDLQPIPRGVRAPVAGQWFSVWQNGGRDGQKEYRKKNYKPEMVHVYRNLEGQPLMAVLRCRKSDGGKFFIPVRLAEPREDCPVQLRERATGNKLAYINEGPALGHKRPLYGIEDVAAWHARGGRKILFVEGEKCRDATKRFLKAFDPDGEWLVLSAMGGASSTIYADWEPLLRGLDRKVRVLVWQDADKLLERPDGRLEDRQKLYAGQLMTSLIQGAIDLGMDPGLIDPNWIIPPEGVESGWDLADAEAEGWTPEQVHQHIVTQNRPLTEDMIVTRAPASATTGAEEPDNTGAEVAANTGPFEEFLADELDVSWVADEDDEEEPDMSRGEAQAQVREDEPENNAVSIDLLPDEGQDDLGNLDTPAADAQAEAADRAAADEGAEEEIITEADPRPELEDAEHEIARNPMIENEYFRALGYLDNVDYFMSMASRQVFALSPSGFTQQNLLHLAPLDFWRELCPKFDQRNNRNNNNDGEPVGIDWTMAYDMMIQACYMAGRWDPRREVRQGARQDGRSIVFHTGEKLHVSGEGTLDMCDFQGRHIYTTGPMARTPDFERPFPAGSAEIEEYLDIIRRLNWRPETREMSILATFGWVMISPICGILEWRPHLYLDGERGAGKTWILDHLINPALGDYAERVVSNTSEPGLRNILNNRSIPVIFDEAEGEDKEARKRMDGVLRLARHSSSGKKAVVAQGVSGGGGSRFFSTSSTFLLTSILLQIEASADKTRFGRARLASGHRYTAFVETIEEPAARLLTPEFSDRLVARIVHRAPDYRETYQLMVEALCLRGVERRVADVYGTFATGAWLALKDGVPEDIGEAANFLGEKFDVVGQVVDFNDEMREDRDHHRVLREISSADMRIETRNSGAITVQIGALLEVATGHVGEDDIMISQDEAADQLRKIGLRLDAPDRDGRIKKVLIHKNSPAIRNILEKTPYARGYVDVIHQAEGVTMGPTTRFGPGLGSSRTIVVPLEYFYVEGAQ